MQRHEEIYDMIRDYEESDDATEDMLSLASEIDALTAERDRLAAENAELKQRLTRSIIAAELAAANATLDKLREAVPEGDDNPEEWPYGNGPGCVRRVQAILYPPNLLRKSENKNDSN